MKKLKLLIQANNLKTWTNWKKKINYIKTWALHGGIDLTIDLRFSSLNYIPFINYNYSTDPYNKGVIIGNNAFGIHPGWYDENVSINAKEYDIVAFLVNEKQWKGEKAAGWRYDHNLGPVELQVLAQKGDHYDQKTGQTFENFLMYFLHELSHAFYEIAGTGPDRTHEFYYGGDNYCIEAINAIKWPVPNQTPDNSWLVWLLDFIRKVSPFLVVPKITNEKDLLNEFCLAIQKHEGWFEGSRSQRNNNPGNLRYIGQAKAIGADKNNFAIFVSYEDGFEALKTMIRNAASGLSKIYHPNDTILDFFNKYAPPSDNNNSQRYAEVVASALGVGIDYQIKNLIL